MLNNFFNKMIFAIDIKSMAFFYLVDIFTPIIPPKIPKAIPVIIIITDCIVKENCILNILENRYSKMMYTPPIIAPLISPFFLIFTLLILLPISILSAVIIIIVGLIIFSETFVYVNTIDKINKKINVIIKDIPKPFNIFIKLLLFEFSKFSII